MLEKHPSSPMAVRTKRPTISAAATSSRSITRQDSGDPVLKLSHPLLRALDSSPNPSPSLNQSLAQLLLSGLSSHPLAAGRAILKLSSSPCSLPAALSLFSSVRNPDAFLCNTLLRSFLAFNDPPAAFGFYTHYMLQNRTLPNNYTFTLLAKLFADLGLPRQGRRVHAEAWKRGFEPDLFIRNALIHMYSCFHDVAAARRVFGSGYELDSVSWNSMISGLVKNNMVRDARDMFDEMPEKDLITWNVMMAGHAAAGEMAAARGLFFEMPKQDVVSWNTLIDGYARLGEITPARSLFDRMPQRNSVSWNLVLAMYARAKNYRECLRLFDTMIAVGGTRPNEATFVSVLTACANLGEFDRGKWVHSLIEGSNCSITADVLLSTSLLTMYAKCGDMNTANAIFDRMEDHSVVSWNSLIAGYGMHGHVQKAIETFFAMQHSGETRPNDATFVCLLSACAHAGLVLEGWWFFNQMVRIYNIEPKVEHFGCMVDLLGRAGLLKDSEELAKKTTGERAPALWGALLSASRRHCNSKLGEMVSRKLIEMEPKEIGAHVLLSNIYAGEGRWEDVEKVRKMMKDKGLEKPAGVSLVEEGESERRPSSVAKRCMVYSMMGEIGTHLKLSCREAM